MDAGPAYSREEEGRLGRRPVLGGYRVRLAMMQSYFFPYIGYFQLLASVDRMILYENLNHIRHGWVHRNRIRLKGRDAVYCSVPLLHASSFVKIRDLLVDRSQRWPGKFLDLLTFNYRKARFFEEVYPVIEEAVSREAARLAEVNWNAFTAVASFLGIAAEIRRDTPPCDEFEAAVARKDAGWFRALGQSLGTDDVRQQRVLYVCRAEGADAFHNPIGGLELYSRDLFGRNGIRLRFLRPRLTPYEQSESAFIPGLSILDVLMHCGREGTRQQLADYDIV
ncbi:MAG TPA: WbqC family protein [Kiritimatiellia bacterium]|nr:WbqC family protein [Kiritimatiellia bacterium]HRZ12336.1 WbqC family protein [Kiritimatiellia bacterium]HSA17906.1 WbqC family protein [Kiritimatiellia bacterium]